MRQLVSAVFLLGMLFAGQGICQTATQPAGRAGVEAGRQVAAVATGPSSRGVGAATQNAERPVFRFAVIADPHIEKVETIENLRRFLCAMREQPVDFLVILGDICSYRPDLLEKTGVVLRNGPLKVYAIAGNKDNDYGKHPEWYRNAIGESNYTFDHKGWRFIMYDSFNPPTTEWLAEQLATPEAGMPVIFCAHAPPEPRDLFKTGGPWGLISKDPNVKIALGGHWHRRASGPIGRTTFEVFKDCFLRGAENPGTFYILEALPSGKVEIQEHSVTELQLPEAGEREDAGTRGRGGKMTR